MTLLQDLRYAVRRMRNSLGFTAVAVISLALAIGANTTIFSYANQMLYVRLGVPKPNDLRILTLRGDEHMLIHSSWGSSFLDDSGHYVLDGFTFPVYQQLLKQNHVLEPLVAFKSLSAINVTANGLPQAVQAEIVSGNFYDQMQVRPQLGRPIVPADDGAPGTGAVAVLSDAFWHRAFGGSREVIGRVIRVNATPLTIIGVNPPRFVGPDGVQTTSPQIFLPLSMVSVLHPATGNDDPLGPKLWWLQLMARAKPDVSAAQAEASLNVALNAAIRATTTIGKNETVPHVIVSDGSRGDTLGMHFLLKPLYVLLALGGLVLLLACANIANLVLARAFTREREMGVRLALGADRRRILQQVLTESLLLSVCGGAAGLFLGYLGRNLIPAMNSISWQGGEMNVAFDWRVFGFTAVITIATGVVFGLLPAWRSTKADVNAALKEGGLSATKRRKAWSGKIIVGFQVMLSTLLVIAAIFFLRTLININSVDPGFRARGLLLFDITPPASQYPPPRDVALQHRMEEAFAAAPGVQGVTLSNVPLVAHSMWSTAFHVEGAKQEPTGPDDDRYSADLDYVGANFFRVMSIPILAGRGFTAQDTATSEPVSVINQALARKFFPHGNPIGRRFRTGSKGDDARWVTIIGICGDTRYHDMKEPPPPLHFDLYLQKPEIDGVTFIVRSSLPPSVLVPELRRAAQQVDPDLPLTTIRTQQQQIAASMQEEAMFASLTAGFGILALALACVGIYGIMAYTVSQRTNEIGIRLALGAVRGQIRRMILLEAGSLASAGVVVGVVAAFLLSKAVESLLYGLEPHDPITLAGTGLLLLGMALLASWIPAVHASRVEPMEALRHE